LARSFGRSDFTFGQFGENFAVGGLSDDEVCIRDRYRIGAGLFEVTQPRVTCYRVCIRMNEPRMAALLVLCRWSDRRRLEATYRQLAGDVVPALLDMLRCSMFGGYPPSFS